MTFPTQEPHLNLPTPSFLERDFATSHLASAEAVLLLHLHLHLHAFLLPFASTPRLPTTTRNRANIMAGLFKKMYEWLLKTFW